MSTRGGGQETRTSFCETDPDFVLLCVSPTKMVSDLDLSLNMVHLSSRDRRASSSLKPLVHGGFMRTWPIPLWYRICSHSLPTSLHYSSHILIFFPIQRCPFAISSISRLAFISHPNTHRGTHLHSYRSNLFYN